MDEAMTPNDLDRKAREQFNAWLLSRGVVITDMHRRLDMFDAWQAALRLAVPDGFVVVPAVLTDEMCQAGHKAQWDAKPDGILGGDVTISLNAIYRTIYAAMIAAAPTLADEGES